MITLRPVVNVYYFVDDIAAATAWYTDLLGAPPIETYGTRLVTFRVGDTRFTLRNNDEYNTNAATCGTVAYWDVEDIAATVAECIRHGAVAHRGPAHDFHRRSTVPATGPVRQPAWCPGSRQD
jgi:catechol 2,3-dioxygenase-like lactoylglutathione lyase family enzyme